MILSSFQKPSRYINSEINCVSRKAYAKKPAGTTINVALSFPDVYEVGMSHLGLKILYDIINNLPYASAERVFAPWTDLEQYMRSKGISLSSLETKTSLKDFDIVGFSLQYELSYTTVLNMLELGGIPVRSEDRIDSKYPLIIAGGPCTVNPLPMSPFIDVFLIGDGEDAIVELLEMAKDWKASGDRAKELLLKKISKLNGFYVPRIHTPHSFIDSQKIKRRFIESLDNAPYPLKPVVPYTSIVHDRINIEVSRGCSMGCRFCQAGMIYRPVRERMPETVLKIAEESLKSTGYDEVSLTSLSAGDYTHLLPVVKEFNKRFGDSKIALSLPSLRVASVSQDVLKEIKSIRKTGFTMAPEAATERLRNVINKDFSEDDYERALHALFAEGWLNLKMYFMIGLPTERDEDIEAIQEMALKAIRIAKKKTNRFVNMAITISPFVPKPHTPFQWCGQTVFEEIKRKQQYLKEALGSKKIKYKGHDERMSFIEAVLARGDEKLSPLIEEAWKLGCRFDGWSDFFDFQKWLYAMDKTGIDGRIYAEKTYKLDEKLPWDFIDTGIKKEFLVREYKQAVSESITQDCKKICTACGLKCGPGYRVQSSDFKLSELGILDSKLKTQGSKLIKVRVQFSKIGSLRYLSHLELVTAILRGLRRAEIPFDFTKGFHPSPKVSFGPPLSVGIAGEKEYFDMEVFSPFNIEFYMRKLNDTLPEGIRVNKMAIIPMNEPSLNSFIQRYEYRILQRIDKEGLCYMPYSLDSEIIIKRDGRDIDISPCIESIDIQECGIRLIVRDYEHLKVRIKEVIETVTGMDLAKLNIIRTGLFGWKNDTNEWIEPL